MTTEERCVCCGKIGRQICWKCERKGIKEDKEND